MQIEVSFRCAKVVQHSRRKLEVLLVSYTQSSMRGGKQRFDEVVPLRKMVLRGRVGVLARARRTRDGDTVLGGTEQH